MQMQLFSLPTQICVIVLIHQEQFVLPRYSGICNLTQQHGWLTGAVLSDKNVLPLPAAISCQWLHGSEWPLEPTSSLYVGIWSGFSWLGMFYKCFSNQWEVICSVFSVVSKTCPWPNNSVRYRYLVKLNLYYLTWNI